MRSRGTWYANPPLLLRGKYDLHRQRSWRIARSVVAGLIPQRAIHGVGPGRGDDGQLDGEVSCVDVELVGRIEAEAEGLSRRILERAGLDAVGGLESQGGGNKEVGFWRSEEH